MRIPSVVLSIAALACALLSAAPAAAQPVPTDDWRTRPEVACDILRQPGVAAGTWAANLWPGGIIPYVFSNNTNAAMRALMLQSMSDLEAVCNIHFVVRGNQDSYLIIQDSPQNGSYVGMQDFPQVVNIHNWREFSMCHELMHALGTWHEQSRPDRDQFISVAYNNIQPQYWQHFDIVPAAHTTGQFDFDSVMLSGTCFYSICCDPESECDGCFLPCSSMRALPEWSQFEILMGQRTHLSQGDIAGLETFYGAPTCGIQFGKSAKTINSAQCEYILSFPLSVYLAQPITLNWFARPTSTAQWIPLESSSQNYGIGVHTAQTVRPFSATGASEQIKLEWAATNCNAEIVTSVSLAGWSIAHQPVDVYRCSIQETVFLNVDMSGPTDPAYQWQVERGTTGSEDWLDLADGSYPEEFGSIAIPLWVNRSTLVLLQPDPAAARRYRCVIEGPCSASLTSDAAKLDVCLSDIDCDHGSDLADFFAFFNFWDKGNPKVDLNADLALDLLDFFAFFNAFDAGC